MSQKYDKLKTLLKELFQLDQPDLDFGLYRILHAKRAEVTQFLEDGGRRKFILVEMGDYFDTVLLPRIKKVTFTPDWKDGKPKRLATPEEAERSPRILKVVRLESYEDTLNNLETRRTETQGQLLLSPAAQSADGFKEQYLLRYMLDVETRGSQSLLNVQAFADPTAYKLKVKRPGSDESHEVNVDLLETFNSKGIRNLGPTDPKIQFHETVKEIEQRLGDASVRLESFIVSNTPSATMRPRWNMDKAAMQERHILFQEEDKDSYVRSMLAMAAGKGAG